MSFSLKFNSYGFKNSENRKAYNGVTEKKIKTAYNHLQPFSCFADYYEKIYRTKRKSA